MSLARRSLILGCAALAGDAVVVPGSAQPSSSAWPSKAIVVLVPFPAGGGADLSARLLAEHLKTVLGQAVVVENKPGAGGNLAAAEASRAQADGHTLFIGTNGTQTINQTLYRHLSYDPAADFVAIGMMWSAPHLAVIHPAIPARSLESFIAYARARPGELSYGSSGIGSSTHLFGEMFKARSGIEMVHVPYRGQAAALEDLIAGRIAAMFPIVPDVVAATRADQVRALALAANSASEILPDVPRMPQLGYPDRCDPRADHCAAAPTTRHLVGKPRFCRTDATSRYSNPAHASRRIRRIRATGAIALGETDRIPQAADRMRCRFATRRRVAANGTDAHMLS